MWKNFLKVYRFKLNLIKFYVKEEEGEEEMKINMQKKMTKLLAK